MKQNKKIIILILVSILILAGFRFSNSVYSEELNDKVNFKFLFPKIILTKENSRHNLSLSDYLRNFDSPYQETLMATLAALPETNVEIISFDSSKGQIDGLYRHKERLYILVVATEEKITIG
jgi:peptidoglycan hydrolase CwlO-like protein